MADLWGHEGRAPGTQILSISCSFLGKFGQIVYWRPLEGWRPHLGEILDPPTFKLFKYLFNDNDVTMTSFLRNGGCSRDNAVDSYIVATEDVTSNSGEEPWLHVDGWNSKETQMENVL